MGKPGTKLTKVSVESSVLSLAEYVESQRTAEIKDKFASTLPFDLANVSTRKATKVLERTKVRWSWFDEAVELDKEGGTWLGTLGYLPQEIRNTIFGLITDDHLLEVYKSEYEGESPGSLNPRVVWANELDAVTNRIIHYKPCHLPLCIKPLCDHGLDVLWVSRFWMTPRYHYAINFPDASPTIGDQIDTYLLNRFTIKFTCPTALKNFFLHVPSVERQSLQRMHVEVGDTCHYCPFRGPDGWSLDGWDTEGWSEVLKDIPPKAMSASIRVDFQPEVSPHGNQFWKYVSRRLLKWDDVAEDVLELTDHRRKIAGALVKLVRQIARCAPNAAFYVMGTQYAATSGSKVYDSRWESSL